MSKQEHTPTLEERVEALEKDFVVVQQTTLVVQKCLSTLQDQEIGRLRAALGLRGKGT